MSDERSGLPHGVEVVLAAAGLAAVSPLLTVAALAISLTSEGPVCFRQRRVGRSGRSFALFKLRTMRVGAEGAAVTASGDTRITSMGRILRRAKIDELPGLWNVIRGDMSIVGPRPEVPSYVDLEDDRWRAVLRQRPGLTHPVTLRLRNEESLLASVQGDRSAYYRNELLPYKLEGYLEYMRKRSWLTDLQVLMETGLVVLFPSLATPPTSEQIAEKSLRRVTSA